MTATAYPSSLSPDGILKCNNDHYLLIDARDNDTTAIITFLCDHRHSSRDYDALR